MRNDHRGHRLTHAADWGKQFDVWLHMVVRAFKPL